MNVNYSMFVPVYFYTYVNADFQVTWMSYFIRFLDS